LLSSGACEASEGLDAAGGAGSGGNPQALGGAAFGGKLGAGAGSGGASSGGRGGTGGVAAAGGTSAGGGGGNAGRAIDAGNSGGGASGGTGGALTGGRTAGGGSSGAGGSGGAKLEPVSLTVFDGVVFYDAYASVVREPVPAGVQRLRNDLFTRKLADEELDRFQDTLHVRVVIGALCDNYDRIGSVALALVPKGQSQYTAEEVERIEVGRYITPFMDRNRMPDEVSYEYEADNLASVLRRRVPAARTEPTYSGAA
jgi:hypothetical protein